MNISTPLTDRMTRKRSLQTAELSLPDILR